MLLKRRLILLLKRRLHRELLLLMKRRQLELLLLMKRRLTLLLKRWLHLELLLLMKRRRRLELLLLMKRRRRLELLLLMKRRLAVDDILLERWTIAPRCGDSCGALRCGCCCYRRRQGHDLDCGRMSAAVPRIRLVSADRICRARRQISGIGIIGEYGTHGLWIRVQRKFTRCLPAESACGSG